MCFLVFYIFFVYFPCLVPAFSVGSLKEFRFECIRESKVNPWHILDLKSTREWKEYQESGRVSWHAYLFDEKMKNNPLKKWVLCMMVKTGQMSEQAVIRMDDTLANFSELEKDRLEKIINKCIAKKRRKNEKPFETAWNYVKCRIRDSYFSRSNIIIV